MREGRLFSGSAPNEAVIRIADVVYRQVDGADLHLDLYRPAEVAGPLPAVIFVHGDGPADAIHDIKDWGQYVSWGELIASSGFAAVTFNHRSSERQTRVRDVAEDIDAAFECVQNHADAWQVDLTRLGLWSCSMGVPFAFRAALERAAFLRCLVALYGPVDLSDFPLESADLAGDLPPLLLCRAGRDTRAINQSIDAFVKSALERNLEIDVVNHPTGEHGFDVRNDCRRTHEIVDTILHFFVRHLGDGQLRA